MNAYKLADILHQSDFLAMDFAEDAATMLRQQANRIAELEKLLGQHQDYIASWEDEPQAEELYEIIESNKEVSSKPVAWATEDLEEIMSPEIRQAHIDHPKSCTHKFFSIPLYTHPIKQLSDERIEEIASNLKPSDKSYNINLTRAIIKEITE